MSEETQYYVVAAIVTAGIVGMFAFFIGLLVVL